VSQRYVVEFALFVRVRSAVANEGPGALLVLYTKNRPAREMTWQVYTYVLRSVMYDLIAIIFVLEMMQKGQSERASTNARDRQATRCCQLAVGWQLHQPGSPSLPATGIASNYSVSR
jgi:hypothetical protein